MSGIDFNLSIQPGKLMDLDYFIIQRFDLGYTYIHSEVVDKLPAFSKFALENLRNQLVIGFELRYFRDFYQTVNLRYADRVNMEDFVVVDTRIGLDFPKFRFYVDLTNIFNVEYRETNFVTLPGRWFKVGAAYQLSLK
jgi:vitamin B12 transporter